MKWTKYYTLRSTFIQCLKETRLVKLASIERLYIRKTNKIIIIKNTCLCISFRIECRSFVEVIHYPFVGLKPDLYMRFKVKQ